MSKSAMRKTSKLRFAAVGFFALSFLLLQPVCAAYERHSVASYAASASTTPDAAPADDASRGSLERTPSCLDLRADAVALEFSVAAGKNFAAVAMAVASPLAPAARAALTLRSRPAWRSPAPPLLLSYYARSARILR